jgi:hypothetical protein
MTETLRHILRDNLTLFRCQTTISSYNHRLLVGHYVKFPNLKCQRKTRNLTIFSPRLIIYLAQSLLYLSDAVSADVISGHPRITRHLGI